MLSRKENGKSGVLVGRKTNDSYKRYIAKKEFMISPNRDRLP